MLLKECISSKLITIDPESSMISAARMMKENKIKRIPVVDKQGKLVGIISDRDIKESSPSKAISLDLHELYYLLSDIKTKHIMKKNPFFININSTVEKAAVIMLRHDIGGLPIVNDDNIVEGMITNSDIKRILTNLTGSIYGGVQICVEISGAIQEIIDILNTLANYKVELLSILSGKAQPASEEKGDSRRLYIRLSGLRPEQYDETISALQKKCRVIYLNDEDISGY